MKKKAFLFFTLILFISLVYGAKVSPVRFDLSIARGTSQELSLNLFGSKGFPNQDLIIYPTDLFMSRTGALSFEGRESKISAVKWIKMETSKLSVLENQTKEVKFTISIPSNASPGEYYAVIMVEPENSLEFRDKKDPIKLNMKTRIAVVVVLEVPGRTFLKKGEVYEVKVAETDTVIKIISSFKNSGNIHLDVLADATIKSADGKTSFGKFELTAPSSAQKAAFVFPDAIRDFEGSLKRQLPAGEYLADVSYDYGYKFNKAHQTQKFTIKRDALLDETKAEFLSLKTKEISQVIPEGAKRNQVITVTNIDYRPLSLVIESADWLNITPKNLVLKPGEVRNLMLNISVSEYDKSGRKESTITFAPNRGLSSEMDIIVSRSKELLEKKENQKPVLNNLKK